MESRQLLSALEDERLGLADLLATLDASQWEAPSLCRGWTVHDVAAHLTLTTRLSKAGAVLAMLKARGDINRMIRESVRRRAGEFGPDELVTQLRETARSANRPLGTGPLDPLVDILVHGQDIARPSRIERPMPIDRVVPALGHVWDSSFYGARRRFEGLRFVATDSEWTDGSGERVIEGPAAELLVLSTGRPAGLAHVSGSGVEEARERVGSG